MRKLLFIFLCFISCQDEISLNFPIESQRLVVEGGIEPNMPPYVILSKNQGYFDEINVNTYNDLFIYDAEVVAGRIWTNPMEAVLGAAVAQSTALSVGSTFAGAHGLAEGGHSHDSESYRVVGMLAPTGTVIDRLVMTSLESVWALHTDDHGDEHTAEGSHQEERQQSGDGHEHEHALEENGREEHEHEEHAHQAHSDVEVTALLLTYRTPLAATTLPRQINSEGALQAAAPAMEVSRVLQLVGVGITALGAFAWVLVATAALSIFAALYGSLRARRGELAMLRCLGATRVELLFYLIVEGLVMSALGVALGFVGGHSMTELLGHWLASSRGVVMTGWAWAPEETMLLMGLFLVGVLSAVIPAVQAYRTDVAKTLAVG